MSCSIKYNCCQQPDLCPKNKVCKPFIAPTKPWKRFTCECRDGYYGKNCDQPIRSCAGYLNVRQKSGEYIVVDSQSSEFKVYCHFDSDGVWTLVQSYSYENIRHGTNKFPNLKTPLSENKPVRENAPVWEAYRLSKSRMESIKNNSTFLQFTCNYEKPRVMNNSDYLQIFLENNKFDVLEHKQQTWYFAVGRGKIGRYDISQCEIQLLQYAGSSLHVKFKHINQNHACKFNTDTCYHNKEFFGRYVHIAACVDKKPDCVKDANCTTQLWLGIRNS